MKKPLLKKLLSIGLVFCIVFAFFGCSDELVLTENDFYVWTTSSTEKIMQDQTVESFRFQKRTVSLEMFQNEYESYQIIISTKKDIKNIDVVVSELTAVDSTIPTSSIDVFFEKYLEVTEIFDKETKAPLGNYPDALIPFTAIKEYKENNVSANKNQGIYVRVKTAENQTPGVYHGNITIICDDIVNVIPVQVEVYDFVVSEERHNKSIFLINRNFWSGELNSSQEMFDKYVEALFEYRLSPDLITLEDGIGDIDYYIEKAYEFMQDPRCTNITIPFSIKKETDLELYPNGEAFYCFNIELFKSTLRKYIEKSLETQFDMLKKSICYFAFVDEAVDNKTTDALLVTSKKFKETIQEMVEEVELDYPESEMRDSIVTSLKNLRQVQTDAYINEQYNEYVNAWCPKVSYYHTKAERELYENQEEKWWYTCMYPRAPYPTYHIEDSLLSARLLSWMQAEYGVTGNLYWSANLYALYNGKNYEPIDNYVSGNAERFNACNGDGYLFYPGAQYGLDEPIPSIRLEAIRDGLEEYELINSIKEYCESLRNNVGSVDVEKVISILTNNLYQGTQVISTEDAFYVARNALKNIIDCMQSSAGMTLCDIVDDGYGKLTYKVFLKDGFDLKKDGQNIVNYEKVTEGKVYSVDLFLENSINQMHLSFDCEGKTYSYPIVAKGKVIKYSPVDLAETFVLYKDDETSMIDSKEIVDDCFVEDIKVKYLKLSIKETSEKVEQAIYLEKGFLLQVNKQTQKAIMHLYYLGEDVDLTVRYKTNTLIAGIELLEYHLVQGENIIEFDFSSVKWNVNTKLEYLAMVFGDEEEPQVSKDLYIKDVIVYAE